MIKEFNIIGTATYDETPHKVENLKKINFFFGSNGSGKTTISRFLCNPDNYPQSSISWVSNPTSCCVYNSDFVEQNFVAAEQMPGIFTLGAQEADTVKKINDTKESLDIAEKKLLTINRELNGDDSKIGKRKELSDLVLLYQTNLWKVKQELDQSNSPLVYGLEGFRGSKERYMTKLLSVYQFSRKPALSKDELERKAKQAYTQKAEMLEEIVGASSIKLLSYETDEILQKKIIGKDDVDIASLIKKLNNSDWVTQGVAYIENSEGKCPFCQRELPQGFSEQITEYFDDTYKTDMQRIRNLLAGYKNESSIYLSYYQAMQNKGYPFLDNARLKSLVSLIEKSINENIRLLENKISYSSNPIALTSLKTLIAEIEALIGEANVAIQKNNDFVKNLGDEKEELSKDIWNYTVEVSKNYIEYYLGRKASIEEEIQALESDERNTQKEKVELRSKLSSLESELTSVKPTLTGINDLLSSFGFTVFKLDLANDNHSYRIIRDNGKEAKKTLSEGEKNFVTFLYFFYLLRGSQTETGFDDKKIVIIDDPVSSLDNDILFIVSSLVRDMYESIIQETGNIKQMIILSHNIYFYKEVSLTMGLRNAMTREFAYWTIRKSNGKSTIVNHLHNPVKSTYEMLWDDVRQAKNNPITANTITIQNTLRRILEHYFKLLGGVALKDIPKQFVGEDIPVCRALISWTNSGSHSEFDDYHYSEIDSDSLERYLNVFQRIFEQSNSIEHYNMMMKISDNFEEENDNGQA